MREILFRGKRLDNGEWVYGYYAFHEGFCIWTHRIYTGHAETDIYNLYPDFHDVAPSTVGQYTGLTDKNGKRIFEGDVLEGDLHDELDPGAVWRDYVVWREFGWHLQSVSTPNAPPALFESADCREGAVIGNIYDNPELLEVSE